MVYLSARRCKMEITPRSYVLKKEYDKYIRVCARFAKFHTHAQRLLVRRVLQQTVPPVYFMKRDYDTFGLRHPCRQYIFNNVYLETIRRNERWALFRIKKLVPRILSYLYRPGGLGFQRARHSFSEKLMPPLHRLSLTSQ